MYIIMYCEYIFCKNKCRKIPPIKEDKKFNNWNRRFHKCCFKEFNGDKEYICKNPLNNT